MQNAFTESVIGRLQDELLNERCSRHWLKHVSGLDDGGPINDRRPYSQL